jgi:cytochrome b
MTDRTLSGGDEPTKIWDAPTRIVHWLIVALIVTSWYTGSKHLMDLHRWSGYGVLTLVLFRLYWGVVGGSTARFSGFVRGPRSTLAYVRTLPKRVSAELTGHNPLGAWSVVAIMTALTAQVTFGLFAVDVDGLESGPLSYMVSFDTGRYFAHLHLWGWRVIYVLVGLHIAAIAFYLLYKRQNLIAAMIHGRRRFAAGQSPKVVFAPVWRAIVGLVGAALIAWFISKGLKL